MNLRQTNPKPFRTVELSLAGGRQNISGSRSPDPPAGDRIRVLLCFDARDRKHTYTLELSEGEAQEVANSLARMREARCS